MMVIFISQWQRHKLENKFRVLSAGVEPMNSQLQVRMLYHGAMEDSLSA